MNPWAGSAVVYGPPQAMGSKRGFSVGGRIVVVDVKAKALRSYQEAMREAMRETAPEAPLTGPIHLEVVMVMARPAGHYGTGKNANVLKPNAPFWCLTKPDGDKVLRAVQDCGTKLWFRDDSQVVVTKLFKRYAEHGEEPRTIVAAHEGVLP